MSYLTALKSKGYRLTKARRAIDHIFTEVHSPLSVDDISTRLELHGLTPHRSTIYREMEALVNEAILREIDLGEGHKRYEIKNQIEHQHLICDSCHKVDCVELPQLNELLQKLTKEQNFSLHKSSVELIGYCKQCLEQSPLPEKG